MTPWPKASFSHKLRCDSFDQTTRRLNTTHTFLDKRSHVYPLLSQQTQPRFPFLFDQRSPSDPCPLVNDFITQMVKGHWDSPSLLPRSQTRPDSRENSGNGRTHGGSNHFQSREQVLLPFSLGHRPGQTRGRRLGFPQSLYTSNAAANHACRAPLSTSSPGQSRERGAPFNRCAV